MAPEGEIVEAIQLLAETEGIFTETAGGVVISGLRKIARAGIIDPDEVVVAFITGNGLKTQEAVERVVDPVCTAPDYEAFQTALAARESRS
jgi:threonine synthase